MTTYEVTAPNGKVITRTSDRVYTHAVLGLKVSSKPGIENAIWVASFTSNIELAKKEANRMAKCNPAKGGYFQVEIAELKVAA